MKTRLSKIRSLLKEDHLDGLLVTHEANIHYLTGFPAQESWLLVTKNKTYYITDFRYVLEVKKGIQGIPVVQYTHTVYETLLKLLKDQKIKRLGFEEDYVSVSTLKMLRKICSKGRKIIGTYGIVEKLREIKGKEELTKIHQALKIHEKSFTYLKRIVRPGLRERDILLKLERFVKSYACGFSFDPIVASGTNSCLPHAKVSSRILRRNDVVLIDWGIDFKGYKSDLTRMFFLGKIPKLIRTVNDTVTSAQQKAVSLIKAGVPIAQVDYQARNYLGEHKLAKYFGHALGHGVGLEIHEDPRIFQQNTSTLEAGMVITVEPAVYIPNKFGIRIEDMVLVTEKGAKVLSGHIY
jgi:Xaa-Pro aminopeptidase